MDVSRTGAAVALLTGLMIAQEVQDASSKARPPSMRPIVFERVDRRIGKLPKLNARRPAYGLFLFGANGEHRVWAVLDKSRRDAEHYDVLYLDRDADGDLTGDSERIAGMVRRTGLDKKRVHVVFDIGQFRDPGSKAVHEGFQLTWNEESVRFKMLWRGEKVTMGVYGPTRETYQKFGGSPAKAPILVPGYDRPFEFQHWMCDRLKRGNSTDFKVFVGNRGDRTGAFSCVDQDFLADGEYVQATLVYRDAAGKEQRAMVKLAERC